jgi:multicomponent Na+:H+ antiporter subunit B
MTLLTLVLLLGLAVAAVRLRDLLGATSVLGAYSLMMAVLWCQMNALDVAFTEAAVGAGISTVLMLAALGRIGRREQGSVFGPMFYRPLLSMRVRHAHQTEGRPRLGGPAGAAVLCVLVGAALLYGTRDMPRVGDASSPANTRKEVAEHYLQRSGEEVGPPNTVTSVLGDYRGYDTMGETTVIFTAALSVLLLLRHLGREGRDDADA